MAAGGVPERDARHAVLRVDAAVPAQGEPLGPSDEQLRAAQWFSSVSQPEQPGADRAQESRSRDGRHVLQYGDGPVELINGSATYPLGPRGVSLDGLLLRLWLDPVGFRLLEERAVVGPDATGVARGDGGASFAPGDVLYREVFLSWGDAGASGAAGRS